MTFDATGFRDGAASLEEWHLPRDAVRASVEDIAAAAPARTDDVAQSSRGTRLFALPLHYTIEDSSTDNAPRARLTGP